MTFPLDTVVELELDGVWTDITSDVYQRDPITITRGRTAEGALVDPSRCNLTLNNRSGDYSPRNPTGAHFGVLGRNTPLRVRINDVPNPSFETDTTGWAGANCTLARVTSPTPQHGVGALRLTASSAANMDGRTLTGTSGIPVAPLVSYTATVYARTAVTARSCRAVIDWWSAAGGFLSSSIGTSVADTTTGWTQVTVTGTAPASAAYRSIRGQVLSPANAEIHYLDWASSAPTDGEYRFSGEVSSWPQKWDLSGNDVWVPIEAAGIMRRLGQGQAPLRSTLYRALTSLDDVVAYWPCEDGEDATELTSALPGHPMRLSGGGVDMASFTDFKASSPLPTVLGISWWDGRVPAHADTGDVRVRFLMAVPAGGIGGTITVLCSVSTTGTATFLDLFLRDDGDMQVQVADADGLLDSSGQVTVGVNGKLVYVSIFLEDVGADAVWSVTVAEVGGVADLAGGAFDGTAAGKTVGHAAKVTMNWNNNIFLDGVALGHVSVQDGPTAVDADALAAYVGEAAGRRIERLCSEEGIAFSSVGDLDDTAAMGPQLPKTLLELLREAAAADLGILYEPRTALGLAYRTRASLYAQAASLELDYATADMSSIEPVDDDQGTRNDVTVKRDGGSSVRTELTTGALSIATPPDGVGRYDEEVTISVETDADLTDQAGWRLHLGTVDEARYPVLGINLATDSFTADAALTAAAQALDLGDRMTVANPPAWLPPEDIQQLAQGFTETLTRHQWTIDVNCSPAAPWDVGVWDDEVGPGEARYESDGTTLNGNISTTLTSFLAVTPTGPLWTTTDEPFDIVIGGERITVTAVTGATSPQTFTVTRSVNGVVKAHLAGAVVRLFHQAVYAL